MSPFASCVYSTPFLLSVQYFNSAKPLLFILKSVIFIIKTHESLVQNTKSWYALPRTAMNSTPILITEREVALPAEQGHHSSIVLLCHELAALHFEQQAESLTASALEREALEPTYVGRGLAVPHARVAGLPAAAVYIAHCDTPIPWPEEQADTVILLAVPAEHPELYLQLLGKTMRWRMKGLGTAELKSLLQ